MILPLFEIPSNGYNFTLVIIQVINVFILIKNYYSFLFQVLNHFLPSFSLDTYKWIFSLVRLEQKYFHVMHPMVIFHINPTCENSCASPLFFQQHLKINQGETLDMLMVTLMIIVVRFITFLLAILNNMKRFGGDGLMM